MQVPKTVGKNEKSPRNGKRKKFFHRRSQCGMIKFHSTCPHVGSSVLDTKVQIVRKEESLERVQAWTTFQVGSFVATDSSTSLLSQCAAAVSSVQVERLEQVASSLSLEMNFRPRSFLPKSNTFLLSFLESFFTFGRGPDHLRKGSERKSR